MTPRVAKPYLVPLIHGEELYLGQIEREIARRKGGSSYLARRAENCSDVVSNMFVPDCLGNMIGLDVCPISVGQENTPCGHHAVDPGPRGCPTLFFIDSF